MNESTKVTPFEAAGKPETLSGLLKLDVYKSRFEQVLGERAPQFISSIIIAGQRLSDVEPRSIIASAMVAATLDLPIDPNLGFAHIVPYRKGDRKYAQFQLGYKSIIQLALRTAFYERMNARAVNAEVFKGYDEVGEPKLDWNQLDETKEVAGYAFAFKLTNGFVKVCYWTKARVEAHAKRYSQAYRGGYETPWKTHFDAMGLKTVIANELRKWGILSIQMQRGLVEDETIRKDLDAPPEMPELSDAVQTPQFEEPPPAAKEDTAAEAAAGLAPAPSAPPAEAKPKRATKAQSSAVAPAPSQAQGPVQAAAPVASPAPVRSLEPAPQPAPAPASPAQSASPAPPAQPAASPFALNAEGEPAGTPVCQEAIRLIEQHGLTHAEVIGVCKQRGVMAKDQTHLAQLSDEKLEQLIEAIDVVAGQIRIDRRARAKK